MPNPLFHHRPLLLAAAGLLLGTVLSASLVSPYGYAAAAILLLTAAAGMALGRRAFALAALFACLGVLNPALREAAPQPAEEAALSGRVCETPVANRSGWTVTLDHAEADGTPIRGRVRLLLTGPKSPPAYGQAVRLEAELRAPDGVYGAGDRYRGITAVAFSKYGGATYGPVETDAYGGLLAIRSAVGERIDALFPERGGIAKAMLLGDKSGAGEEALEAFRRTGILHLMAVSGLHTGILAGAFALLFRRNSWVRLIAVALFVLAYAALTACSPSVLRASCMVLIGCLATPLGRRPDTASSLSLAFLLIVLVNPFAVFYVGFQLSFGAVFGMLTLAPVIGRYTRRLGGAFGGLLAASLGVTIATAPIMALQFQEVNLIAILTNLLVIPLAPLFLVPGLLAVCLSFPFPALGACLGAAANIPLGMIEAVAGAGGGLSVPLSAPPAAAVLVYLAGCLLLSPLCLRPMRIRALYAGGAWVLSLLLWVL